MNKKGFTLIELLAVLIVIGLVVLIVAPKVNEAINGTKTGAYKSSVNTLLRKIKLEQEGLIIDSETEYTITDGVISPDIEYEGEINGNGYIKIDSEGLTIVKLYDNGTCAYKNKYDDNLTVEKLSQENCDIKITSTNQVIVKKTTLTTNSITVVADFRSNKISKNYTFGIYKGSPKDSSYTWKNEDFEWFDEVNRNYYTFNNLLPLGENQIYTYAAKVTTSDGEIIVSTPSDYVTELPVANITFDLVAENGITKVQINYEIPEGSEATYGFQYRTSSKGKYVNSAVNSIKVDFNAENNLTARIINKINGSSIYTKSFYVYDPTVPSITAKNSVNDYTVGTDIPINNLFNIGQYGVTGGTNVCKIGTTVYNNIKDIPVGTHTLACTLTLGNGLSAFATTTLVIEVPLPIGTVYNYEYRNSAYEFPVRKSGYYQVELWGAQGGSGTKGGLGGYTKGQIYMNKDEVYYLNVGQNGTDSSTSAYNGGGAGYVANRSGGGATDIRCFADSNNKCVSNNDNIAWNDDLGLNSRIMVAAGGGGNNNSNYVTGHAGGLIGSIAYDSSASSYKAGGGSQISGGIVNNYSSSYTVGEAGSFGIGGKGGGAGNTSGGSYGGGGGYYGGGGGSRLSAGSWPGGGGSSYISGYLGSIAIEEQAVPGGNRTQRSINGVICTAESATSDITCSYHYSSKIFTSTVMKAGNESMPTHDGTSTMTGNTDNGFAKITYMGNE